MLERTIYESVVAAMRDSGLGDVSELRVPDADEPFLYAQLYTSMSRGRGRAVVADWLEFAERMTAGLSVSPLRNGRTYFSIGVSRALSVEEIEAAERARGETPVSEVIR